MVQIYRGYVDDPRNTDNAWMETVAMNFHDKDGDSVAKFNLHAGSRVCVCVCVCMCVHVCEKLAAHNLEKRFYLIEYIYLPIIFRSLSLKSHTHRHTHTHAMMLMHRKKEDT